MEQEEQEEYLVLGIAVAVSAVATVLTFLLCYQVICRQIAGPNVPVTCLLLIIRPVANHELELILTNRPVFNFLSG